MGHEIQDQQGTSENSSNPVEVLQHGTTVSSTDLVDQVASENVTVIRSVETESLSGEDENSKSKAIVMETTKISLGEQKENGNSKSKAIVMETTKISHGEQKVNVPEPERQTCAIDINCSSGALSNRDCDAETICRICHLSSDSTSETLDIIQLGCGCKGELGIAHCHCAEAWFKLKGNRFCEICGEVAKNITGVGDNRFMEEWNERRLADGSTNSSDRRGGYWRGQSFCNFLLACLVMSFLLPWFFRVNMF